MKVNVTLQVNAWVENIEARMVCVADLLLDVDKDFKIVPSYVRDAQFVMVGNNRMLQMELGDPEADDPDWKVKLFHPNEEITVVRVR